MITWILYRLSITLTSSLILSSNPLTSGLIILSLAVSLASIYALFISSWFAFIIFLIYIGGILVIFSYFVALTPNQEKVSLNPLLPILLFTLILLLLLKSFTPTHPFLGHTLITLFWSSNNIIFILLGLLLLLTIIIVVKITNLSKGPLRPFH